MPPEQNNNDENNTACKLTIIASEQQIENMSQIDLDNPNDGGGGGGAGLYGKINRAYVSTSRESLNFHHNTTVDSRRPNGQADNRQQQQQEHQSQQDAHNTRESYADVIVKQITSLPARARQCFNAKMEEAHAKATNRTDLVFKVVGIFTAPILWLVCLISTVIMPIVLLLIGLIKLDKCPARSSLATYIVCLGFAMSASNLLSIAVELDIPIIKNHVHLSLDTKHTILGIMNLLFNSIGVCLFIMAASTIYTMSGQFTSELSDVMAQFPNRSEPTSPDLTVRQITDPYYCDRLLYNLIFWFVTIVIVALSVCAICALLMHLWSKIPKQHQQQQQQNQQRQQRPQQPMSTSQHSTLQFQSCDVES